MLDLKLYDFQEEIINCKKENIIMNWGRGIGATTAILYKILVEKPKIVLIPYFELKNMKECLLYLKYTNKFTTQYDIMEKGRITYFKSDNGLDIKFITYGDDINNLYHIQGVERDVDLAIFYKSFPFNILDFKIKQNISIIHMNDYYHSVKRLFDNNNNYFYSVVERKDKNEFKKTYKYRHLIEEYYNEIAILSDPFEKELNINDLERCFHEAKEKNKKYVGVKIQMEGFKKHEIIIDENVNFDSKFNYYKKAYNEDLTLNNGLDNVEIIGFAYGDTFEEIEKELLK